ncbi:MAG TPA: alpha-ketoacid dehydrogenase subunit beta [Armatimonadota bacterium]|nr:alpha-ketoacid dehydrogenase subunit beta [Armatimonadota bacterium]
MRVTIAKALRLAITEEMRRDPTVICIGEDIGTPGGWGGAFTVTWGLEREFGFERIRNTPISEAGLIGAAVGAAMTGLRPIADFQYADFMFCAADQLINQAPKMCFMSGGRTKVPLVVRAPVGASTRGAQHAQSPEAWIVHTPGWKVAVPSTPYDAKGLLKTAVRDDNPVFIFEHKLLYGSSGARKEDHALEVDEPVPDEDFTVPLGVAAVRRPGKHITVVATHLMLYRALQAAEELAQEGIELEVIDPRTLVPFDYDTVCESLGRTGHLMTVEEDTRRGGWGAEIVAEIAETHGDLLQAPPVRVATYDAPIAASPVMERFAVPDAARIAAAAMAMVEA